MESAAGTAPTVTPSPEGRPGGTGPKHRPTPSGEPGRARVFASTAKDFFRRVYKKAEQDNIFFMAGAIAFNVLVAIVPLILATLGIAGIVVKNRFADPAGTLLGYLVQILPGALNQDFIATTRGWLVELIDQSSGLLSISTLFFIWVATRLVGTLRTALREIFDIHQDRGIVAGKIFDVQMVIAAGTLLAVNVLFTVVIRVAARYGIGVLAVHEDSINSIYGLLTLVLGFLSIWFMFVLIYRYLPARRIAWRIAIIAATFTGGLFELMKFAFSWYIANLADYRSSYGNFATVIVVFLWVYYMAIAFILGGEVGQVAALHRIRRRQKERLV